MGFHIYILWWKHNLEGKTYSGTVPWLNRRRLPTLLSTRKKKKKKRKTRNNSDQSRADMAANRTGTALEESGDVHLIDEEPFEEHGRYAPKRHARVTVKYNRKELQRRLDVEKWIDERLDVLYAGQVGASRGAPVANYLCCVDLYFSSFKNNNNKNNHWVSYCFL